MNIHDWFFQRLWSVRSTGLAGPTQADNGLLIAPLSALLFGCSLVLTFGIISADTQQTHQVYLVVDNTNTKLGWQTGWLSETKEAKTFFIFKRMERGKHSIQEEKALHFASSIGNLKVVKSLILEGKWNIEDTDFTSIARQDYEDEYNKTPLYLACTNGHLPVVQFLVIKIVRIQSSSQQRMAT